jgi:MFS family permease
VAGSVAALLHERRFARFLVARTISVFGNGIAPVALAFGVLSLPHASPSLLSVVQAALVLPMLLFLLLAGAVADRVPRIRLLVLAELGAGVAWSITAVLIGTRHAPAAALIALAFMAGTAIALFSPTLTGVVPDLAPPERLQSANGVLRIGVNAARVLGYAAAGLLVATVGAGWALAVDASTFFVSAALLAGVGPGRRAPTSTSRLRSDLASGAREFFSRQWLWVIVVQFSFLVAATQASVGVLGPLVSKRFYGGAPAWSAIVVASAVGTIAGAGLALRLRPRRPLLVATVATIGMSAPMLALGLPVPLVAVVAASFVSGVTTDVFGVLWETTIQREVPAAMLSRVSAYDWLGSVALAPVGIAVAGPVAVVVGPRPAELGCAAFGVLSTLCALASPGVRRMRAPAEPAVEEAAAV